MPLSESRKRERQLASQRFLLIVGSLCSFVPLFMVGALCLHLGVSNLACKRLDTSPQKSISCSQTEHRWLGLVKTSGKSFSSVQAAQLGIRKIVMRGDPYEYSVDLLTDRGLVIAIEGFMITGRFKGDPVEMQRIVDEFNEFVRSDQSSFLARLDNRFNSFSLLFLAFLIASWILLMLLIRHLYKEYMTLLKKFNF